MNIDVKKVMGESPKDVYEAIDQMIIAQSSLLDALHIIQSTVEFPDCMDSNIDRMTKFLTKYSE